MVNVGVIGYGYWGPNIVRNFSRSERANVLSVCDIDRDNLKKAKRDYPFIETTSDVNDVISSTKINAVAVITPVSTHFELAKKALNNGKHVFVEKPFTSTISEAEQLIELAQKKNRMIMVDHTFLFTGAVRKLKELVEKKVIGDILYYDSMRVNLGLFQHDVNVIWDLAPHDFSIMDYLVDEKPAALTANGKAHINGMEDVAYVTVYFSNTTIAHFNVNWLSPVKVRTTLIGGMKKMLVWNDVDADEKIKVYDKGVEVKNRESVYKLLVSYRAGDIWSPRIEHTEALQLEAQSFVSCILNNHVPINDGHAGLRVVKLLAACDESLRSGGRMVNL
jgi:predicted dehydrogenase